jgi:Ni,Fe-hydrogenase maturation factor
VSARKILVFGNLSVAVDSLAVKVARAIGPLPDFEFVECDSAENLENYGPDLLILDVAKGISVPAIIEDLTVLESSPSYSMHDFDLALTLKLLKKIGKIKSVRIIALPMGMKERPAVTAVKSILEQLY